MAFEPKDPSDKRDVSLPQVRVSREEKQAVEWLARTWTKRAGTGHSLSDVVRICLGRVYAEEFRGASKAERADAPLNPSED